MKPKVLTVQGSARSSQSLCLKVELVGFIGIKQRGGTAPPTEYPLTPPDPSLSNDAGGSTVACKVALRTSKTTPSSTTASGGRVSSDEVPRWIGPSLRSG